jgi:hypothetical protein
MRQSGVVNVVVDLPSAVFDQYIAGFESCLACRTTLGHFHWPTCRLSPSSPSWTFLAELGFPFQPYAGTWQLKE